MKPEDRVALVTGASSGIGRAVVLLLVQRGFTVYGTSRNPSSCEKVPGVDLLPLDVRSDESVNTCVEAVSKRAGRLDILVNSAGYMLDGAIEETALEEAKAQLETNFFGVVRMVKAVLPIMRGQGNGQIINISSMSGLTTIPFAGFYAASKFALEGYTEALRHEVKPFNILVSIIEPGFIKTNLINNRQNAADQINDYDPWRKRALEAVLLYEEEATEPTPVTKCVARIIKSKSPRLRYKVGKDSIWISLSLRVLPGPLLEKAARHHFNLDATK